MYWFKNMIFLQFIKFYDLDSVLDRILTEFGHNFSLREDFQGISRTFQDSAGIHKSWIHDSHNPLTLVFCRFCSILQDSVGFFKPLNFTFKIWIDFWLLLFPHSPVGWAISSKMLVSTSPGFWEFLRLSLKKPQALWPQSSLKSDPHPHFKIWGFWTGILEYFFSRSLQKSQFFKLYLSRNFE